MRCFGGVGSLRRMVIRGVFGGGLGSLDKRKYRGFVLVGNKGFDYFCLWIVVFWFVEFFILWGF